MGHSGVDRDDSVTLDLAAAILGGTDTARLPLALIDRARIATSVEAGTDGYAQAGLFQITMDVRDGVDPAEAVRLLDTQIADFLRKGPTEDEVRRVVTRAITRQIHGMDSTGGKAAALAAGTLYLGDPGHYRRELRLMAAATPASVAVAARRWRSRRGDGCRAPPIR